MNVREQKRFAANEPVHITVLGSPDRESTGRVVNASRWGLCLAAPEPLPAGNPVRITWGNHFLVGVARHQSLREGEYLIGLELMTCSLWRGSLTFAWLRLRDAVLRGAALLRRSL